MPTETDNTAAPTPIVAPPVPESSAFPEGATIALDGPLVEAELTTATSNREKLATVFTFGVTASAAAHVLLLLWAIGLFSSVGGLAEIEVIPVELVTDEEPLELAPPDLEEPSQSEPAALSPAQPDPTDDPPDDAPVEAVENAASPSLEEALEKTPADAPAPVATASPPPTESQSVTTPSSEVSELLESLGFAVSDKPLDQSGEAARSIAEQVRRCWEAPTGWSEPRQVSVTVRFLLNRDGTVKGSPAVVEFHASLLGKAAADNAVRAVFACAPFVLPQDTYEQWQDVQVRLTP